MSANPLSMSPVPDSFSIKETVQENINFTKIDNPVSTILDNGKQSRKKTAASTGPVKN